MGTKHVGCRSRNEAVNDFQDCEKAQGETRDQNSAKTKRMVQLDAVLSEGSEIDLP